MPQPNRDRLTDPVAMSGYLRSSLGFFVSVIKSGEPWTAQCEEVYRHALSVCDDLAATALPTPAGTPPASTPEERDRHA